MATVSELLAPFAGDFKSATPDYLASMARARTVAELAMLVRAFACHNTARCSMVCDAKEMADRILAHERAATAVEYAGDIHRARNILRDLGYGPLITETR